MTYDNLEVIVLPDRLDNFIWWENNLKTVPTGKVLPSHKRDIGVDNATGDIIAFIDADAYPEKNWLTRAVQILVEQGHRLGGVCGPGIIPPGSKFKEFAADEVLKMFPYNYRVTGQFERLVDDYPTFNLILWKKYIDRVGGFNCDYLTGEDTLLCKKITHGLKKPILYTPSVIVYHDRRPLFWPFLKQIATYGKHRGYFFKMYPETSRKLVYALPSIGVICLLSLLAYWAWCWLS